MRIGIIGGGISGLTAAYELTKSGHHPTVFERAPAAGGLGSYVPVHKNYLEAYYHHFFETDHEIMRLAHELHIDHLLKFYNARTGILNNGTVYSFSSPVDLLRFTPLSLLDRIRCGVALGFLKYMPNPIEALDRITASEWIIRYAGRATYDAIWKPLLNGKFSTYADQVPALWLWGRIRDRSPRLGYIDGSVKVLFDHMIDAIAKHGGNVLCSTAVEHIDKQGKEFIIKTTEGNHTFDQIIVTAVSPIASHLLHTILPDPIQKTYQLIDHLGAVCTILELTQPVQSQYWLNICEPEAPVLVMVEHTNMISSNQYGGRHIVYLANYLHRDTPSFSRSDEEWMKIYVPFLKKLNPDFQKSWIVSAKTSRVPRAQTIFPLHSLARLPAMNPVPGVYIVNIDRMYPHDRNLNQGAELAVSAVKHMLSHSFEPSKKSL